MILRNPGRLKSFESDFPIKPAFQKSGLSSRAIGETNGEYCLRAIAHYGHLRGCELADRVWPECDHGYQLAMRKANQLVKEGLLLKRKNSLHGESFVLTRPGAAYLQSRGIEAQHGLDISSLAGPTSWHRTMATQYLIQHEMIGHLAIGEYGLALNRLPFNLHQAFKRPVYGQPDGIVWEDYLDGRIAVTWLEQEFAPKSKEDLQQKLRVVEAGYIRGEKKGPFLQNLVFHFDAKQDHARNIVNAARGLWGNLVGPELADLAGRVLLVASEFNENLVLKSSEGTNLMDHFRRR